MLHWFVTALLIGLTIGSIIADAAYEDELTDLRTRVEALETAAW